MRVIAALVNGANYVSELARQLEISRPLLQLHLKKLEAAGLVSSELRFSEEGKAMKFYTIEPFRLELSPKSIATATETLSLATETEG
jgi:predicted transcriptional regulator